MTAQSLATVNLDVRDHVAHVTLNRPDMRNAFGVDMIREITEVFTELNARTDLRAVVLRGEGKSFCSGADLEYMKSMAGFSITENECDAGNLYTMFWTLRSCPHPLLARLHGHVMGGGLGLAAVCDIGAVVEGTQFCFSEAKLGLVPAVISSFVLERMSLSSAQRFMLTAEVFGAKEAVTGGLAHFAGSEAEVEAFLTATLSQIAQNGPEAVRATKKLCRDVQASANWDERRQLTTRLIAERRVSAEGQEGLRSFLEKRPPQWRANGRTI